ncbi:MAG: hypothetical protein ACKVWV_05545 [Planctomycetota bacterium]
MRVALARFAIAALCVAAAGPPQHVLPNEFGCLVIVSADAALRDRWNHTPSGTGPSLSVSSTVFRAQTFAIHAVFHGYARDDAGRARVRHDVKITAADGSVLLDKLDATTWDGPAHGGDGLLARDEVQMHFDARAPLGRYTVTVVMRDLVGSEQARSEASIELVEPDTTAPWKSADELSAWMTGYFGAQRPEQAIPAFCLMFESEGEKRASTVRIQQVFFRAIFERNRWLLPLLAARYGELDVRAQHAVLQLMASLDCDVKALLPSLSADDERALARLVAEPRRDVLTDPIVEPEHVDHLWATFFATGEFAPIRRLVDALELSASSDELRAKAETVRKAAQWSLLANVRAHPLVRNYCRAIVEQRACGESARNVLAEILSRG